jgi:hypothetical protein
MALLRRLVVFACLLGAGGAWADEAPLAKRISGTQRQLSKFWIDLPAFEMRHSSQVKELMTHARAGTAVEHFYSGLERGGASHVVIGDGTELAGGKGKMFHLRVAVDLKQQQGNPALIYKGASKDAYQADVERYGRAYADQASLYVSRYAAHALVRRFPKIKVLDLGTRRAPNLPHIDSPHVDDWSISDREVYGKIFKRPVEKIRARWQQKLKLPPGGYPLKARAR